MDTSGGTGQGAEAAEALRRLDGVIDQVRGWETPIPSDLAAFKLHENAVEYQEGPHAPLVGPLPPRGPATGLVIQRGRVVGQWGTPDRPDVAFSVTKTALSVVAGLAVADGLIDDLDRPVAERVALDAFATDWNRGITWRHLLTLTSEWSGSLWGIPDSIDWHRTVPKRPDDPPKGTWRVRQSPGSHWEFNDVRVNVLALALTRLVGEDLGDVLRRRVLDPLGAVDPWSWHGYTGSGIVIGDRSVPVVAGGGHWGGGLQISARDLGKLGQLHLARGRWNGDALLPDSWFDSIREATPQRPDFGLMWWTNRRGTIPALSEQAIWGSGIANLIVVEPAHDAVIVLRWYDVSRRDEILARILGALDGAAP
ncbi:serine hydrolase domain-containing protein [Nitrospirillum iridis]|uniref:CubicO group peptidase (Beta-lactamase class C family) n=1 Tax=Nitrospirillum iridis TaxID=765888 RepID=A0A7X0B401_9PROT|nr:serine hydrolase [Nitrospirillum iridis]MBB6255320.1 CubicO group peptidase (beta-lactamase class C family) [Nitrospirillum iridis]